MNIDTIMTRGVSTMKNKLPPFIEIYRALIATPSISATEEALDQSNADLITLLAQILFAHLVLFEEVSQYHDKQLDLNKIKKDLPILF